MEVTPYSSAIGAEVLGLDLSQPLPQDSLVALNEALLTHQVLFVRDQTLTPAQQGAVFAATR